MPITDTTMDDQHISNLIRQGGKMRDKGVDALYRKYVIHLSKFLIGQSWKRWTLKLNQDDAEEIVQETYIKVVRHCESFKGDSTVKTWLFSIGINCMIDYLRDRGRIPKEVILTEEDWKTVEETVGTFDPPPANETLEDCVQQGFAEFAKKFPERAHALSLAMEGFDTAHIAAAIHHKTGGIREYLSQCRKRIEKFLLPCRDYLSAA